MLLWKAPDEQARPGWLQGCADVQQSGRFWWVGSPLIHPDFDQCSWHPTANGWGVCLSGDFDPKPYERPQRWAVPLLVTDTRGVEWVIGAILTPDG